LSEAATVRVQRQPLERLRTLPPPPLRRRRAGTISAVPERDSRLPGPANADQGIGDRELAARLMAGDHTALSELYRAYAGLVFGVARRVVGDDALAEDVTQDVFLFIWQCPDRYDPTRGTLRSWLGLLAHRRSVDRVRIEARRSDREARVESASDAAQAGDNAEVDEELTRAWLAARIKAALTQLPDEQREAVTLAYYGGRTYRQVAAELAIPEGTAKSRLRLALAKLDELLQPTLGQDTPAWT
jgi:RNA polymerase sigma-70 factor (ECF subfamily)